MKQTLIGESPEAFRGRIRHRMILCGVLAGMTLAVLVACCLMRTDENHVAMLLCNIVLSAACGCFVLYRWETDICPLIRIGKLMARGGSTFAAKVEAVSESTHRIPGLDCYQIRAEERVLFLPVNGAIKLTAGKSYRFKVADNVIVEAQE